MNLNRQYLALSHVYHPAIFHLKQLVAAMYADVARRIFLICDAHGHSSMMTVTLYDCAPDADHKYKGAKYKVSQLSKLKRTSSSLAALAKTQLAKQDAVLPNYVARAPSATSYSRGCLRTARPTCPRWTSACGAF